MFIQMKKQSVMTVGSWSDATLVASDLSLHCLPLYRKKDAKYTCMVKIKDAKKTCMLDF